MFKCRFLNRATLTSLAEIQKEDELNNIKTFIMDLYLSERALR